MNKVIQYKFCGYMTTVQQIHSISNFVRVSSFLIIVCSTLRTYKTVQKSQWQHSHSTKRLS